MEQQITDHGLLLVVGGLAAGLACLAAIAVAALRADRRPDVDPAEVRNPVDPA